MKHPKLLEKFAVNQTNSSSENSSPEQPPSDASTLNDDPGDIADKGEDSNIVGWYGAKDSEVGIYSKFSGNT